MPLLVLRVPLASTNNTSTCSGAAPPVAVAPAAEHSDALLFDGLALGHGDDVDDKAEADRDDAATVKLEWLRSQIIGAEAEFASPFGTRRITYADHTASGRCLRFVEEFVLRNVLPFYGEYTAPVFFFPWTNEYASVLIRACGSAIGSGALQGTPTRRTATWACTRASWPGTRRGT